MPLVLPTNTLDFLNPRVWTGVVRSLPLRRDYIGDKLLPRRDVTTDFLEWTILDDENPLSPMVALGSESPSFDGMQFRTARAAVAYSRIKRRLAEQDVRVLRAFGTGDPTTVQGQMGQNAAQHIRDEAKRLSDAIDARVEWLQLNALQGSIVVNTDEYTDINFTLTYPVVTHTASPLWEDVVNSDPLGDIQGWLTELRYNVSRMVLSRRAMLWLQRNTKIRAQFFVGTPLGSATQSGLLPSAITNVIKQEFGIEIDVYDAEFSTRTNNGSAFTRTIHRMLPYGVAILLPDNVGYTAEAPAAQNDFNSGKFTWFQDPARTGQQDPWAYELGCGWYGLPVLEHAEQIIVATIGSQTTDAI